jgi:hypothetical protein
MQIMHGHLGQPLLAAGLLAALAAFVPASSVTAATPSGPDRLADLAKANPDKLARVYLFVQRKYPDLSKTLKAYIDKQYPDFWTYSGTVMQGLQKQPKYAGLGRFVQKEILETIQLNTPTFQWEIRQLIDQKYPILWTTMDELRKEHPDATLDDLIPQLIAKYPNLLDDILKAVRRRPSVVADLTQRVAEQYPGLMDDLMKALTKKYPKLPAEIVKLATAAHPDLIPQIEKLLSEPSPQPAELPAPASAE